MAGEPTNAPGSAETVGVGNSKASVNANGEHATTLPNGSDDQVMAAINDDGETAETADSAQPPSEVLQLTVKLPHAPGDISITVSTQEQMQDVRQSITESPQTFQYSCFHLEHKGKRISDYVELSEVADITQEPVMTLVEDPYTEAQARMHVVRVRDLIGAAGNRIDAVSGIDAGTSLCETVVPLGTPEAKGDSTPMTDYSLKAPASVSTVLSPPREAAPKTVKSMSLSAWNPPPHHLRARGHLLYLQVTTNEGEQHYITCHASGFYVNRSTNHKFDPAPRTIPKLFSAHSLLSLLEQISPSFSASFQKLQQYNGERDPLSCYSLSNAIPASPWLVSPTSIHQHQSDLARTQEPYLIAGADGSENLRDWNEELQSTREMAKDSIHDRIFRERLTSKLFAEYNEAAVRGAVLVARGELQPLNPTETPDAQIFLHNNVFYSFGADGVGTFAPDGGDDAARVATGKDVQGVRAVNQIDINGLFTPATVVVDFLGKRIVGQSIVPGIFKPREPGEHQIDYGGVEGKDIIASNEVFAQAFSELSGSLRVKKHAVWDKEGKRYDLEGSVETKGLLGTDGRKYVLDLYRITPLDATWLEQHCGLDQPEEKRYPHRMTVIRPELVESYRVSQLRAYIAKELEKQRAEKQEEKSSGKLTNGSPEEADDDGADGDAPARPHEQVDVSAFSFALNPDVFSGQRPVTDEEKAEYEQDEAAVRAVCGYLHTDVLPKLIHDMSESDVGFPMDGQSLTRELHKRGINVRYLGEVARLCGEDPTGRLGSFQRLVHKEMVCRAFKHLVNKHLRHLPFSFAASCISHLLNCLLGVELNEAPSPEVDEDLKLMYPDGDFSFETVTPATLRADVHRQVALRFRYDLPQAIIEPGKQLQYLREICLKMGFQLEARDYDFLKKAEQQNGAAEPQINGQTPPSDASKKKKKKQAATSPNRVANSSPAAPSTTFHPDNILNLVPIVKEASPRSTLAEEALDAGRVSIQQDQKELGQELLLESLGLHEQIYGILHPEVARVYYALSTLYYSLDEKNAAVELAKKAVIVSERTLGVDNAETLLAYLNLSLFEHATGNTHAALAYVRHALELWKIVYGPRHPDSITTINNVAVMIQALKRFHESRQWFEASLEVCEAVSGKQTINTATLLFQLAQAMALDQDTRGGVVKMRESYKIFEAELGPDNPNTKEAKSWFETLTSSAVNQAKQANMIASRRVLFRNGRTPRVAVGARPQPPPSQAPAETDPTQVARAGGMDQRSVEELMKYINGEGSTPTPKKKTAQLKHRQQRPAA